jgi:2-polyprenyl-3-methyl-5-hydroxy-6-metoxy-1,4-benzoquinol methylase
MIGKKQREVIGNIPGDYQYKAYFSGHIIQQSWHFNKIAEAEDMLNIKPGDHILDIGCGSGVACLVLGEHHRNAFFTGVDPSPKAIEFANNNCKRSNNKFINAFLPEPEALNYPVTKILLLEVIEHMPANEAEHLLSSLFSLLENNGSLIISTPNRKSLWPIIEFTLDLFRLVPKLSGEQHFHIYTQNELLRLVEKVGFTLQESRTINFLSPFAALISKKLAANIHKKEVRFKSKLGSVMLLKLIKE